MNFPVEHKLNFNEDIDPIIIYDAIKKHAELKDLHGVEVTDSEAPLGKVYDVLHYGAGLEGQELEDHYERLRVHGLLAAREDDILYRIIPDSEKSYSVNLTDQGKKSITPQIINEVRRELGC